MESNSTSASESSQLSTELAAAISLCNFPGNFPMMTRQPFLGQLSSENHLQTHDTITNSQDHQVTASSNKRNVTEDDRKLKKRDRDMRYRQKRKEDLEKFKKMEEMNAHLEQEIARLKQEHARRENEVDDLNKQLRIKDREDALEVMDAHLKQENARLKNVVNDLIKQLEIKHGEDALEVMNARLENEVNDLNKQLRIKDREDALEVMDAHLKQENARLKEKEIEQNAAFFSLQKEVEKAKKDVEEAKILNVEQGVVIGHVQGERSMAGEPERCLQIENQELRGKCENFEAEHSFLRAESIRLNAEINDLKEQLRIKDRENIQLQERVVYLESKVNCPNIDLEVSAGQLAGSKASDRVRRSEEARLMENLKQGAKELKAINKALLDRLVKLESKLEMQEVEPSSSYTQREHSTM